MVRDAMQHFQWAVERFQTMSARNSLARAAMGVLHAIYVRLKKSLGLCCKSASCIPPGNGVGGGFMATPPVSNTATDTPTSTAVTDVSTATSPQQQKQQQQQPELQQPLRQHDGASDDCRGGGSGNGNSNSSMSGLSTSAAPTPGGGDMYSLQSTATVPEPAALDWSVPENFDWSSIQPIYAMGDLAYNDLMGMTDDGSVPAWDAAGVSMLNSHEDMGDQQQPWQFGGDFGNDSVWNLLNHYAPF